MLHRIKYSVFYKCCHDRSTCASHKWSRVPTLLSHYVATWHVLCNNYTCDMYDNHVTTCNHNYWLQNYYFTGSGCHTIMIRRGDIKCCVHGVDGICKCINSRGARWCLMNGHHNQCIHPGIQMNRQLIKYNSFAFFHNTSFCLLWNMKYSYVNHPLCLVTVNMFRKRFWKEV